MIQTEKPEYLRLGVNIDHVATIRNARGGRHPDPVRAAHLAVDAGADGITVHLREDRRHISDKDVARLKSELTRPLNLEMAATDEMCKIALKAIPHACMFVPERRQELTTEGGLDVTQHQKQLIPFIAKLKDKGIRVSLFVDPDEVQIRAASHIDADIVELHTGTYCEAALNGTDAALACELDRLKRNAELASKLGLEVHAGHGLTFDTVGAVAAFPQIVELNIGHFLVGEAIFSGLHSAIQRMRALIDNARAEISGSISA